MGRGGEGERGASGRGAARAEAQGRVEVAVLSAARDHRAEHALRPGPTPVSLKRRVPTVGSRQLRTVRSLTTFRGQAVRGRTSRAKTRQEGGK